LSGETENLSTAIWSSLDHSKVDGGGSVEKIVFCCRAFSFSLAFHSLTPPFCGAVAGAGGGLATQTLTRGKEVKGPAETVLRFRLEKTLILQPA
jgi:hypothetical protein